MKITQKKNRRSKQIKLCETCGIEFHPWDSDTKTQRFCGRKCVRHSEEHKRQIGEFIRNRPVKDSTREKLSRLLKGRKSPNPFKKGHAPLGRGLPGHTNSEETRRKISIANGSKRGWITPINKLVRNSDKYKKWRTSIFERDDYTCQECGIRGGVELAAHHIKSFARYPELRFELSNGITLCRPCHMKTDSWGHKLKSYENSF